MVPLTGNAGGGFHNKNIYNEYYIYNFNHTFIYCYCNNY